MKNILGIACMSLILNVQAQTQVTLEINHQLNGSNSVFNTTAQNNLGHDFELGNISYYMSEFTVYHDGISTHFDEVWALVKVNDPISISLGSASINHVDSISFGIGVEKAYNHLDPSTYIADHPLAHHNPSMHWGWSGGYRFAVMEGQAGAGGNQLMEFHALGDDNYFLQTIVVDESAIGNQCVIELNAEYTEAFYDIDLTSGIILHGVNGKNTDLLQNFANRVFTFDQISTSVPEVTQLSDVVLFPNPVQEGQLYFTQLVNTVQIYDLQGRLVLQTSQGANRLDVSNLQPGQYLVKGIDLDGLMVNQPIVIL